MTVKVKINSNIGGHKAGDTITVTPGVAEHLKERGLVDEPKTSSRTTKSTGKTADGDADD